MLGASKSASAKQINQSYRKVAKSLHPGREGGGGIIKDNKNITGDW